jgi:hypothetical protein
MEDCVKMLESRGLNPRQFEFSMISWPY